jgi:drug/metabolite transporter (DMT)-like permease
LTSGAVPRADPGRTFVLGHLLGCSLFWGSSFLFIKLTDGQLSPFALAACRGLIGAVTLALWISFVMGQKPWPARAEMRDWLVLGTSNGWMPNVLVAYALTQLDSGPAAMIQASGPLVTAGIAHFAFADERLTRNRIWGIITGFIGVALIIGPSALDGRAPPAAVLAMFGVSMGYAFGNLYTRTIPVADPARLALGQQVVSGIVATILALAFIGTGAFTAVGHNFWPLLALGILATALPMALFMRLIRAAGPTRAALTGYLVPAVAVLLGVLVLGEKLDPLQVLGGVTVLAGIGLVTSSARKVGQTA